MSLETRQVLFGCRLKKEAEENLFVSKRATYEWMSLLRDNVGKITKGEGKLGGRGGKARPASLGVSADHQQINVFYWTTFRNGLSSDKMGKFPNAQLRANQPDKGESLSVLRLKIIRSLVTRIGNRRRIVFINLIGLYRCCFGWIVGLLDGSWWLKMECNELIEWWNY